MLTALIAALCMMGSDITYTVMVMAEAANRGWLAGGLDLVGYYVGVFTTTIAVSALQGHNTALKIWVLAFVGIANLFGTKGGQVIGSKVLKRLPKEPDPEMVAVQEELKRLRAAVERGRYR